MKIPKKTSSTKRFIFVLALLVFLGLSVGLFILKADAPLVIAHPHAKTENATVSNPVSPKMFAGANACKTCHQAEFTAWQGSHHALAMQEANDQSVLGDFNNVKFKYHGEESTFFKQNGQFMVRTDGPDGKLAEYPIVYTFGVTPLQQYLIAFPGGRFQALSIAWDSRSKAEGGQHWFHLYPDEKIGHQNQLHWTGRYQSWNMQCAECHSTHLRKGYDAVSDSYKTTFSEINVACEACHGPASRHVEWAQQARPPYADADKGLSISLQSHWQDAWTFQEPHAQIAQRNQSVNESLMNTCWTCHARRSTLVENSTPGLPLEDTHRPALLTQPIYYADGQQRDEDYTWGSFRQSKMFQNGVTCMDCHEPHALKLRAEGNALCTRCHKADVFDTKQHHFHPQNSKGSQCVDCHAPEQSYMVIDGRHDHSFRLPRPDLSESLDSPNACTQCHQKRKPKWAADAMDQWYGKRWRDRQHYGTVLYKGATQGIKALPALIELAQDASKPAIVRATAIKLSEPLMSPDLLITAQLWLKDADPSVRTAALGLYETIETESRVSAAAPLLNDPVLGVRIEAARILAEVPDSQFPADRLKARASALQEYQNCLALNADWPSENINQGNLLLRQGQADAAIIAYQRAMQLDPLFAGAYVNLADAYRQLGQEEAGEKYLRQGLVLLPFAADLHHSLGLLLVRKSDHFAALVEFAEAARLAPENAHYAYVYAVALHSAGKSKRALAVLKDADKRHSFNPDILNALISLHLETGDHKAALAYARKAAEAAPKNPQLQTLIEQLMTAK